MSRTSVNVTSNIRMGKTVTPVEVTVVVYFRNSWDFLYHLHRMVQGEKSGALQAEALLMIEVRGEWPDQSELTGSLRQQK